MNAILPKGVTLPIPEGAGRPENRFDPETRMYLAKCRLAREQGANAARSTIFVSEVELLLCCEEYFEWCENNPLKINDRKFSAKTCKSYDHIIEKRRIWTVHALCRYLMISTASWVAMSQQEGFRDVVAIIEQAIYDQKLEGAAADQFNTNVIIRHLGLSDKQEHISPPTQGEDINDGLSLEDAAEAYAREREAG